MNTAVLYMSRYGTTEEYAHIIASYLGNGSRAINLRAEKHPDLSGFDSVIIGVSIYAGRPVRGMGGVIDRLKPALVEKPVALFITCMHDGERAQEQLLQAYPEWLSAHATLKSPFGGRYTPDTLKGFDKWILKAASKSGPAASRFSEEHASSFAHEFAESLGNSISKA